MVLKYSISITKIQYIYFFIGSGTLDTLLAVADTVTVVVLPIPVVSLKQSSGIIALVERNGRQYHFELGLFKRTIHLSY
jgi:hypothetical protein